MRHNASPENFFRKFPSFRCSLFLEGFRGKRCGGPRETKWCRRGVPRGGFRAARNRKAGACRVRAGGFSRGPSAFTPRARTNGRGAARGGTQRARGAARPSHPTPHCPSPLPPWYERGQSLDVDATSAAAPGVRAAGGAGARLRARPPCQFLFAPPALALATDAAGASRAHAPACALHYRRRRRRSPRPTTMRRSTSCTMSTCARTYSRRRARRPSCARSGTRS